MDLLQNLLDTCTALTRRIEHLEQDKVAQALEITKLKQRVKKLERKNKASKLQRLKKDVVAKDVQDVEMEENDDIESAELQEVVEVVTTAKLITEVVTAASATITVVAPQLTTATAPTLTTAPNKGKRILVEEPKPLKKQAQIRQDEAYARELEAELNKNIDWDEVIDHVQRKQKQDNVMDYFKGMTYDDIRLIFEKYFNSNVAFLQKTKEQVDEEDSRALKRLSESQDNKASKKQKLDEEVEELKRHLQIVPNDEDDVYTEATPLALKVPVVDYEIYTENNKPYYKIKRADGLHQLYLSFLSMLRNFDREDLEVLWRLVKELFASTKPKNFSDDFLLTTLGAIFGVDAAKEFKENMLSFRVDAAKEFKENLLSDYCCQAKLMLLINAAKSS
uniref:Uncharacterized protein n=1 Tax=Tanacetum cinerariifolium TaxID=118510 RepID=A0A699GLG1_TANCI|nr:hypothetical protein [Tanacetum cinerariifolium]